MKIKNSYLTALTCASLLGTAALSQAAVILSEDFTYTNGALNTQNGGTGFSNAWTSSTNVTTGVVTGTSPSTRAFTANEFGSTGTIWLSFDWGFSSAPTNNSYGGLTFYDGSTERLLIGNIYPSSGLAADFGVWGLDGYNSNQDLTTAVNYPDMKTGVARITLGVGATSTVDLWVGATGSPVDVSGPAMGTSTGLTLAGVDNLRINGENFVTSRIQSFDNLLVGTTMLDVDAIPEPSAALLGGLGLLALLRRRR